MKDELRIYIDKLFKDAPMLRKTVELKEEILQNLIEKYDDLIMEGKSEEAAYNIVVAGIGDISPLIAELSAQAEMYGYNNKTNNEYGHTPEISPEEIDKKRARSAIMTAIGVIMCIVSFVPLILLSGNIGAAIMLIMVAAAVGLLVYGNSKQTSSSLMIAIGSALCVLSVVPLLLIDIKIGAMLTCLIVAIAVGILVYNFRMRKSYRKTNDSIVEEFREWNDISRSDKQLQKALNSALWAVITAIYFIISFSTGAWYITWIVFLIGGALEGLLKAIYDLLKRR